MPMHNQRIPRTETNGFCRQSTFIQSVQRAPRTKDKAAHKRDRANSGTCPGNCVKPAPEPFPALMWLKTSNPSPEEKSWVKWQSRTYLASFFTRSSLNKQLTFRLLFQTPTTLTCWLRRQARNSSCSSVLLSRPVVQSFHDDAAPSRLVLDAFLQAGRYRLRGWGGDGTAGTCVLYSCELCLKPLLGTAQAVTEIPVLVANTPKPWPQPAMVPAALQRPLGIGLTIVCLASSGSFHFTSHGRLGSLVRVGLPQAREMPSSCHHPEAPSLEPEAVRHSECMQLLLGDTWLTSVLAPSWITSCIPPICP